jgi:hypothetical protein
MLFPIKIPSMLSTRTTLISMSVASLSILQPARCFHQVISSFLLISLFLVVFLSFFFVEGLRACVFSFGSIYFMAMPANFYFIVIYFVH